jgi:hypothetical protein
MRILRAVIDELLLTLMTLFCGLMLAIGFVCGGLLWLFDTPARLIDRVRRG